MRRGLQCAPMELNAYPWLFRVADVASRRAQRAHFVSLFVQLVVFIIVAVLALVQAVVRPVPNWLNAASAFALATGILIVFINRERKYDRTWFEARAVAESTKTLTWRFIMHVPPFSDAKSDVTFIDALRNIQQSRPSLRLAADATGPLDQITRHMQSLRAVPFGERRSTYMSDRIEDQLVWYSEKARSNGRYGSGWFWTTALLQIAALALVIAKVGGLISLSPASMLMTIAASATAWSQAKRFDELSTAYSIAAHELMNIKALLHSAETEPEFLLFVEDTEEAISREHTMWRARRNAAR